MTKAELVEKVCTSSEGKLSKKEAVVVLDTVFNALKEELVAGNDVTVHQFGTFKVKERKERKGFNPKTQEPITIAATKSVTFKPSASIKEGLNHK
jgi:DNA-binding protein HU-beta